MAKFEPAHGKCLLFVGQDMAAIGGIGKYTNGYCNHFPLPYGITTYTNLSPGGESFGYYFNGNDGLLTTANWGAGDICAQCFVNDSAFANLALSIGLSLVSAEKAIAKGEHDEYIRTLGNWIKSLGSRPVFLRIGYEFDGWEWNHYDRKNYLRAWKRIHDMFTAMQVVNVAFVWQSKGYGTTIEQMKKWYPGDDIVDWCGYSYFDKTDGAMLQLAREHGKPVFIAEATPVLSVDGLYVSAKLSDEKQAATVWEKWFLPFLEHIHLNKDVVKAISYINADWTTQPMWMAVPVFNQVDARLQSSDYSKKMWQKELAKGYLLQAGDSSYIHQ